MICALPLEKIRGDLPELIMDGFEQSLASLLIAVAPARKPSRDLAPSLSYVSECGPEMRPEATSFRYYR